ncbi:hypothetical protein, partial [Paracoccus sp. (in: a-proteobacteria)]|uniref:hypothetical protein n=1 Tax=Paracoccus sp. TaxID=267 RepID=UPI0032204F27
FLADAMALFAATHAPIFAEIHRMAAHHSPVELPENTTDPDIYEPLLTLAFFRRLYDPSFLKAIGTYLPFLNLQNLFLADVISHQAPLGAPVGFDMIAKHRDEHLELFAPDLPRVAPYFARTFVLAYLTRIVAHEVCHIAGEHFRKQARAIPLKENLIPAPGDKPRIWLEAEADALVIPYLAGHTALEQEIEWQSPYFSLGTAAGASVGFPLSVYTASFTLGRPLDDMDVFVSTLLMNRAIGEFPGLLGTHPTAMERMDVAFTGECLLPRPLRTNKDLFEITLSALCVMYHVMKGSWIHMEAGSQFPRPAPLPDDHLKMHPLLGADALLERIRKATALDAHDGQRLRASMEQFRSDPVNAWNINAHTAPHYEEMTEFLKDPFPRIKVI